MTVPPAVLPWARSHHGLVTIDVWIRSGGSRSSFQRAVRGGVLLPVTRGVAALCGTAIGPLQRMGAAVLRHGPDDVFLSYRSGAWLWGAPIAPGARVQLVARRPHHRTKDEGVVIHRPDDAPAVRVVHHRGLPVAAPCGCSSTWVRPRRTTCGPPWSRSSAPG